jgi:hypothetical protein
VPAIFDRTPTHCAFRRCSADPVGASSPAGRYAAGTQFLLEIPTASGTDECAIPAKCGAQQHKPTASFCSHYKLQAYCKCDGSDCTCTSAVRACRGSRGLTCHHRGSRVCCYLQSSKNQTQAPRSQVPPVLLVCYCSNTGLAFPSSTTLGVRQILTSDGVGSTCSMVLRAGIARLS